MQNQGPAALSRAIHEAWRSGRADVFAGLTSEDVVVSGYLSDGRPIRGKEAVLAMVEAFSSSSDDLRLTDVEELDERAALLTVAITTDGAEQPDTIESFWLWTFAEGKLRESHAFASREAALAWFGEADDSEG